MTADPEVRRWARAATRFALIATMVTIGGCNTVPPPARNEPPPAPAVQPLDDEQSRAQVIDAAQQIVQATNVKVTFASFQWEWCNDQGEPPYRGRVGIALEVPSGSDSRTQAGQLAATMATQPGWVAGPLPGLKPFGEVVHKGGAMAIFGPGNYPEVRDSHNHSAHCESPMQPPVTTPLHPPRPRA